LTPGGPETARLRRAAARILAAGLQAADPAVLVARNLELRANVLKVAGRRHRLGRGRLVMVAAGKAAGAMARAAERILGGRLDAAIAVASAPGPPLGLGPLRVAGHPIPDARGAAATEEIEALARGLDRRDLLLVLLSGGASALLPAPAAGISLEDKASVTASLLRAGATIAELNGVRKHLSRVKGGGLAAAAAPARVECLALSDVIGDDPATIASGLTAPDPTTFAEALEVLRARGVLSSAPAAVRCFAASPRA